VRSALRERDPDEGLAAAHERRAARRWFAGLVLIVVAAVCLGVVASLKAPYVIEEPGPTFDVLADTTVGGQHVPLISIPGEETYPTTGSLRMLTVYATSPGEPPTWLDVVQAFLDPQDAVLPEERVYPPGITQEENADEAALDMQNSQREAVAAALGELGYQLDATVDVHSLTEDSASEGVLQPGDRLVSINGVALTSADQLRKEIQANGVGEPATLVIERGGAQQTVQVTPKAASASDSTAVLGIYVEAGYAFPFDVKIQLENVGGPSAGMMFALGVYDKLTDGSLTGGQDVAGTGTIDANGEVGPIGGIRQKMWGAVEAGAKYFLAPTDDCEEVVGHVPSGLTVTAVSTLDDALHALDVISTGGDVASLPACS